MQMKKNITHPSMKLAFGPTSTNDVLVKLFSITVTHTFYTSNDALCPDFKIQPTPSSITLMASLGLAFRAEKCGFSIFIQRERQPDLLAYLLANANKDPSGAPEFWERLTFSMQLKNPLFVDITALPIDTKTSQVNLYGCNCQSHQEDAAVVLAAGKFMGGDALYPVVGNEVTLSLPPTTKRVVVTDISGAIVMPQPGCDDIAIFPTQGGTDGVQRALLNFSDLPYDLYTITAMDAEEQSIDAGKYPWTVLYVAPQPNSMVLLDMLFTQPTPESAGVYPISSLFAEQPAEFDYVAYQLPFDARRTYWQYFVVSQEPRGQLRDLQIKGQDAQFHQNEQPVVLPNGSTAIVFKTDTALPLRQKSLQHFQLTGQRRDANGHENAIKITRLPVAASAPVWPSPNQQFSSGISEIFVYV